jgi:hypothetical protein
MIAQRRGQAPVLSYSSASNVAETASSMAAESTAPV